MIQKGYNNGHRPRTEHPILACMARCVPHATFSLGLSAFGWLNRPTTQYNATVKAGARDAHRCAGVAPCPSAGSRRTDPAGSGSSHSYAGPNRSWSCGKEEREKVQERWKERALVKAMLGLEAYSVTGLSASQAWESIYAC